MTTVRQQLVGTWKMIDWRIFRGDELLDPPLGPVGACGGLLFYTDGGSMSATLSALDRAPFVEDSLDGGTAPEKSRAYESIIHYCGTFDVDETTNTVIHHVQFSTFPNFVGRELRRTCVFEADTLKLDTPPMNFGGQPLASYILWQRTK
ncbi:lipocalin-like domain-containing protein [Nocardia fluminea]|uniref:lipocalin-like domain-containing protein n=1 Tax=Nocardia fluminea TaxID=134984 RepID=UPI003659BD6E